MSDDRLNLLLREASVPDSAAALERTVAAARSAAPAEGSERRVGRWSARNRRMLVRIAAATLLLALLLSPPGRAALGEAADLLGKIGGEPTSKDDRGLDPSIPPGRPGGPTVLDHGLAPDGSRYEWVGYRRHEKGLGPTFCTTFAWSDAPSRRGTGGCTSLGGWSPGIVTGMTSRLVRPPAAGADERDYLMIGSLHPRVHRMRILYRHPDGSEHDLPVNLGRVEGELLRRAGGTRPFVVFTSFIPSEQVRAHRLDARYRLASLSLVDPSKDMPMPWMEDNAYLRCMRKHGGVNMRGWIRVLAYDVRGRRIASLRSRTSRPIPPGCRSAFESQFKAPPRKGVRRNYVLKPTPPVPHIVQRPPAPRR